MKENEDIKKFINRYFSIYDSQDNSYESNVKNLINILFKTQKFDRPDGYFYNKSNATLYIFEHFEFDCSVNNKQGSMLRKNASFVNKLVLKEIHSTSIDTYNTTKVIEQGYKKRQDNTITYCIGNDGDKYRDNYISNFEKVFNKHACELEEYIKHCVHAIKEKPTKIIITFLIEDVTIFGTHYKKGHLCDEYVNLLETKQFFDIFKNSNIDFVMFGTLDSHSVKICDKNILVSTDTKNIIDLKTREFYVVPAVPLITTIKRK